MRAREEVKSENRLGDDVQQFGETKKLENNVKETERGKETQKEIVVIEILYRLYKWKKQCLRI